MKTSRKDNWIAKVSKGTVIVYGEGRKQLCKQVKQDPNRQMNSQEQGAALVVCMGQWWGCQCLPSEWPEFNSDLVSCGLTFFLPHEKK